jgi:hypothetical protein
MISHDDEFWDNLFLGCAVAAYAEQAAEEGRFPPDSDATRQRAYRYYEEALAAKNAVKSLLPGTKTVDVRPDPLDSLSADCKNVSYETDTSRRKARS